MLHTLVGLADGVPHPLLVVRADRPQGAGSHFLLFAGPRQSLSQSVLHPIEVLIAQTPVLVQVHETAEGQRRLSAHRDVVIPRQQCKQRLDHVRPFVLPESAHGLQPDGGVFVA
jgi:hypothetical protein